MNKVSLKQVWLNTYDNIEIRVLQCFVSWSLRNIRESNDTITVKGAGTKLAHGYYNFTDLQTLLKKHKITIEKLFNNHTTLTSEEDLNLKNFGVLLGFSQNKAITKNTLYTSETSASLTNRLKDIYIHCSLVDQQQTFSYSVYDVDHYYQSSLLLALPIDTRQPLNGTFTYYPVDGLVLPCKNYRGQEVEFIVESGGELGDYEIFLSIQIL